MTMKMFNNLRNIGCTSTTSTSCRTECGTNLACQHLAHQRTVILCRFGRHDSAVQRSGQGFRTFGSLGSLDRLSAQARTFHCRSPTGCTRRLNCKPICRSDGYEERNKPRKGKTAGRGIVPEGSRREKLAEDEMSTRERLYNSEIGQGSGYISVNDHHCARILSDMMLSDWVETHGQRVACRLT